MNETAIACNLGVFEPVERERHIELSRALFSRVRNTTPVQNGFSFSLPNETDVLSVMGDFIAKERMCCPFLEFHLEVNGETQPILLTLTGPEGTQEFLREEFEEAFS